MSAVTRFKICGLRRAEDVAAAVALGASALGFNFYGPSPRSVTLDEAVALVAGVPAGVERVAVFVEAPAGEVRAIASAIGAGTVQLHGVVTPEYCDELAGLRRIVALPASAGQTMRRLEPLMGVVEAVLLDAAAPGLHGGSGQIADWDEAAAVRDAIGALPLLLAGGLSPHNVEQAIRAVRPYAVDVASGVESAPGVKDAALMAAFAAAVRRADELGGESR